MEIEPDQVLDFVGPILGFESYRRYVLLPAPDAMPFHWLQCVEEPQLAFPVVRAEELEMAYRVGPDVRERLGVESTAPLHFWIIVTLSGVNNPQRGGRANLRAPVVVSPEKKRAAQVILQEDYPVSHALTPSPATQPPLGKRPRQGPMRHQ